MKQELTDIKSRLITQIINDLEEKVNDLHMAVLSARESRNSDTKSSAGDKYETGRAMIQMEIEKNEIQMQKTLKIKHDIEQISFQCSYTKAEFGSLITTSNGTYLLSAPIGKIKIDDAEVFCISLASPIGQALNNKEANDEFEFNGKSFKVLDVV